VAVVAVEASEEEVAASAVAEALIKVLPNMSKQ